MTDPGGTFHPGRWLPARGIRAIRSWAVYGQLPPSTHAIGAPVAFGATQQLAPPPMSASQVLVHGQELQPYAGAYRLQLPCTHTSSRAQALPQPPQFSGSVLKFTHACVLLNLPQLSAGQLVLPHTPLLQLSPDAHWVLPPLQPPQWAGSLFVSTQVPLQEVSPGRQAQVPLLHTSELPH